MRAFAVRGDAGGIDQFIVCRLAVNKAKSSSLAGVISADNLGGGVASAALIAYLSALTNTAYTATQYALFSSLMTLPAKLIGSFSGDVAVKFGYDVFFIYSAVIGLPAIVLVIFLMNTSKVIEN